MDNPTLSHPQLQIHLGSQPNMHSFVQNPHTQEKHANATKEGSSKSAGSNPEHSCCERTMVVLHHGAATKNKFNIILLLRKTQQFIIVLEILYTKSRRCLQLSLSIKLVSVLQASLRHQVSKQQPETTVCAHE